MTGRSGGPGKWQASAKEKGRIWLGFGVVFVALAVADYLDTSKPSRTGRWSWLEAPFFEAFGDNGDVVLASIVAVVAFVYGLVLLLRKE